MSLARALKRVLPYNGRGVHPLQPRFVLLNIGVTTEPHYLTNISEKKS
jgi:hypothetical protein